MSDAIVLSPRLDLSAAQGLLSVLTDTQDEDILLDMGEVTYLGALCLQVLIAAADASRTNGHGFQLINTSDRVLDQLRVMGMTPQDIAKGRQ